MFSLTNCHLWCHVIQAMNHHSTIRNIYFNVMEATPVIRSSGVSRQDPGKDGHKVIKVAEIPAPVSE